MKWAKYFFVFTIIFFMGWACNKKNPVTPSTNNAQSKKFRVKDVSAPTNFYYVSQIDIAPDTPIRVAVDPLGDIFITNQNKQILKYSSSGQLLTTFAGANPGGAYTTGLFNTISGIAVSGSNIWVVDGFMNWIQEFNLLGTYESYIGQTGYAGTGYGNGPTSPVIGPGVFQAPREIAVDSNGNLYVADDFNFRVQVFNSSGVYQFQFGTRGSGPGQFLNPTGIAISGNTIDVMDAQSKYLSQFDLSGNYLSQWQVSNTGLNAGYDVSIAADAFNDIYVAGQYVFVYDSSGNSIAQIGSQGSGDGEVNNRTTVGVNTAVDSNGNVYVVDQGNHRVEIFSPNQPSPSPTITSPSPTDTPGLTPTATFTIVPDTPTPTATTPIPTNTVPPTNTPTFTFTATLIPTVTLTPTPTISACQTCFNSLKSSFDKAVKDLALDQGDIPHDCGNSCIGSTLGFGPCFELCAQSAEISAMASYEASIISAQAKFLACLSSNCNF